MAASYEGCSASVGDFDLDEVRLSAATVAERGEIYLLNWLAGIEKALVDLSAGDIRSSQMNLQSQLIRIVTIPPTASAPAPKPGRPARNSIARCFIQLLRRGDNRNLFDIVQALFKSMSDQKLDRENRVAAFYCVGELMHTLGSQIPSMFTDISIICVKTIRSSVPIVIRHAAVSCLRKSLPYGKRNLTETFGKDIVKSLKGLLTVKTLAILRAAAECLLVFYEIMPSVPTLNEIESLLAICLRVLDQADFGARQSFSRLLAGVLAMTQIEGSAAPTVDTKARKAAAGEDDEHDPYPSEVGGSKKDAQSSRLLTPKEMLSLLSAPYNKLQTTRRTRIAIVAVYAALFTLLGTNYIESYYVDVLTHVVDELGVSARATTSRFEALSARHLVGLLLRKVIGIRILSEQGQVMALREIVAVYLRKWPALMPGATSPSKLALVIALDEATGLLAQLGNAPQPVRDVLYDPLVRLLAHSSHSVQVSSAVCLRTYTQVAPTTLSVAVGQLVELLNRDLILLGSASASGELDRRTIGHANALCALISVIPLRPLYVSYDVSARVMSLAIQLLKQSGNHELHVSGVEIQVAWTLVSALMGLGPNFVRLHLPQLLILWKNALPKPTSKDSSASQVRSVIEWAFLLHIRECTLGSILSFLRHNAAKLVTPDIARRLAALLNNGFSYSTSFANQHVQILHEQTPSTSSALQLVDRDLMLRRRLFQCFVALGLNPATDPFQSALLSAAVSTFADPERYTGSLVQAAIAASAGTFASVWDATDGFGYGVTSLVDESGVRSQLGKVGHSCDWLNRDVVEAEIDDVIRHPVFTAAEHDLLCLSELGDFAAPPSATGVVDAALELFALYLPSPDLKTQTFVLQELMSLVRSPKLERNPGRRMAILVNACTAILCALRNVMNSPSRRSIDNLADPQINSLVRDIIKDAVLHSDPRLRLAGSEAIGRLCHIAGTSFMASQIQFCVSQVVSDTDPNARAGCALAFGEIYRHVGGLAAGAVLKTIVDVLMSLSADPHPVVHFWALFALGRVIDAASLSYSPFINSTLGMLTKLYMVETHEPEGGSPISINLRGDLPAYQPFCKIVNALIGVLGPELVHADTVRSLVLNLLHEYMREPDDGIAVEAIKAIQHFLIFAPGSIDLAPLVATLQDHLASTRQPLKLAAINCVYQLVQRDAVLMSKVGGGRLVEDLFALLDNDPSIEGVRDVILSWLKQTAAANPAGWIDLCQRIMSRATASSQGIEAGAASGPSGGDGFNDEESQGLGLRSTDAGDARRSAGRGTSRWRTQLFALQCLHEVFLTLQQSGRQEHFDASLARSSRAGKSSLLINRVSDLIKMAFTASTAPVMEIRLEGLVVLRDVIEGFCKTRDTDFDDALLLEQYQSPIAAALTPAFAADSFPEVIASAIQICAVFVGSGVVKEIDKMGRILKLLTSSLDSCKDAEMTTIGDLQDLSSTAAVMLKTSIFAAWAEFQVASANQLYLVDVIRPHLPLLCPFWVASLREYARVRTDPDSSSSGTMNGGSFDSAHAGLSKEVALPYYERSWAPMLHATADLLDSRNESMLSAMDGADPVPGQQPGHIARLTRTEPALFFHVVFGLAFEALASPSTIPIMSGKGMSIAALKAIKGLILPEVAGLAIMQDGLFAELCSLCYRLTVTESPIVQAFVLSVVVQLSRSYAPLMISVVPESNGMTADVITISADSKMVQCLQIITGVLQQAFPTASGSSARWKGAADEHAALLRAAWSAFAEVSDLYPPSLREEMLAVALGLYSRLLRVEDVEVDMIGTTLPSLKLLLECSVRARVTTTDTLPRVLHGLFSACLQNVDDMRLRTGHAVTIKSNGNLLAATLILTSLPPLWKVSQAAVEHYCFLLSQLMLSEQPDLARTATHCARSIVIASSRAGTPVLKFCVGQLIPELINFVGQCADQGTAESESLLQEVLKVFAAFLTSVPEAHRRDALHIVLPTFLLVIVPSGDATSTTRTAAIGLLVNFAAQNAVAFKDAMQALDTERRGTLESAIRLAVRVDAASISSMRVEPTISLKSFG